MWNHRPSLRRCQLASQDFPRDSANRVHISEQEFAKLAPFRAMVEIIRELPRDPAGHYHTGAYLLWQVTLRTEDGTLIDLDPIMTDVNWPWVIKSITVGEAYNFPKALWENHYKAN